MAFKKFIYSTTEAALNNAITAKTVTNDDIAFVNENGVMFIQTQGVKFPCGYSKAEADNRYLKLTGGTLTGNLQLDDAIVAFADDTTRTLLGLESTLGMDVSGNGYSITTDAGIDGGFSGYYDNATASTNNNIPVASFNIDCNGYNIRYRKGSGSSARNVIEAGYDHYGAIVARTTDPSGSGVVLTDFGFGFFGNTPTSDSFIGLTPTGVKLYGGSSSKILVSDGTTSTLKTINNTSLLGSGNISVLTSHQDISGKQDKSTAVTHTANSSVGSGTRPVYVNASGQAMAISYALGNACSKTVRTKTAVGNSGWTNLSTDQSYVPDMAFIAYWNGAYSGTSSNLAYCNKGAFGSFATKSSLAFSELTSKPTTISGYGITDAKISSGTITLGSNSITPLTSHQSLANCAQTVTTSGVGVVTGVSKSDSTVTVTKTEPLIQMFDGIETGSITPTSFIVLGGFSTKAVIWSTQNNAFYVKATSSSDVSYYFTISNGTWNGYTLSAWFPQNSTPDRTEAITYVTKYTGSGAYPVRSFYIDYGGNLVEILPKISTSGSGNAITALSVTSSNFGTTINATKGSSFVNSAATSGTGNAVTGYSLSSGKLTLTKGTQFVPYSDVFAGSSGSSGMFSKIPKIGADGCMEVGRYMDFHHSNTTSIDFNVRLQTQNATTSATLTFPTKSGTLALTSQIESQTNVDEISFNNSAAIWASSSKTNCDISLNSTSCIVDMDGWIYTPYIELGASDEDGGLVIYYNGNSYSLNMQKAISLGLFS